MSAIGEPDPRAALLIGGQPSGFTLIEVLVVVAIMALIGGLIFPRVDRLLEAARFASARSMVAAAAAGARAEAIRTASKVTLEAGADGSSLVSNGRIISQLSAPIRLDITPSAARFYGDGSATGGVLTLASDRSRAELVIASPTGLMEWRR